VQPSGPARSLKIAPRDRCLVLNAPEGYIARLEPLPDGASPATADRDGLADFVQLFACDRAQLERDFPAAFKALRPGGTLSTRVRPRGRKTNRPSMCGSGDETYDQS
jgi:hypothetical protein